MLPKILICLLLISSAALGQANKTIADTTFEEGDFIKPPEIYFQLSGGGHVHQEARRAVEAVADFLKENKNLIIEIGIHTDYRGHEEANREYTQRHADTLRNLLIKEFDIAPERLVAKGYGESKPLISKPEIDAVRPEEQERLHDINSRIELRVLKI